MVGFSSSGLGRQTINMRGATQSRLQRTGGVASAREYAARKSWLPIRRVSPIRPPLSQAVGLLHM
jgi:hypothetical protein